MPDATPPPAVSLPEHPGFDLWSGLELCERDGRPVLLTSAQVRRLLEDNGRLIGKANELARERWGMGWG